MVGRNGEDDSRLLLRYLDGVLIPGAEGDTLVLEELTRYTGATIQ